MAAVIAQPKTAMQRLLDGVERVGNMVPHPVVIFLILIGIVIVLSAHPQPVRRFRNDARESIPRPRRSRRRRPRCGACSMPTASASCMNSLFPNFMSFTAVGLMIAAMIGAGVAEESGLVNALIRKLVLVSPAWALTYILAFVGILSSVAADAGYLVLLPLAGVAYASVGRHPLAGLALGFAAVAGAFTVNMLIKPLDAVLVEFTNDAIHLVDPASRSVSPRTLVFSFVSVIFLTVLIAFITDRIVAPRLGPYKGASVGAGDGAGGNVLTPAEVARA